MIKKRKKLTREERRLASQFIPEEIETKKYPRITAIAIGISRAKAQAKKERRKQKIRRIMERYE